MQDIKKCHTSATNDPLTKQNAMRPCPGSLTANCKDNKPDGCSTEKVSSSDSIDGPYIPDPSPVVRHSLIEISLQRRIFAQNYPDISGRDVQVTRASLDALPSPVLRRIAESLDPLTYQRLRATSTTIRKAVSNVSLLNRVSLCHLAMQTRTDAGRSDASDFSASRAEELRVRMDKFHSQEAASRQLALLCQMFTFKSLYLTNMQSCRSLLLTLLNGVQSSESVKEYSEFGIFCWKESDTTAATFSDFDKGDVFEQLAESLKPMEFVINCDSRTRELAPTRNLFDLPSITRAGRLTITVNKRISATLTDNVLPTLKADLIRISYPTAVTFDVVERMFANVVMPVLFLELTTAFREVEHRMRRMWPERNFVFNARGNCFQIKLERLLICVSELVGGVGTRLDITVREKKSRRENSLIG